MFEALLWVAIGLAALILLAVFAPSIAYTIGRIARAIHPPKPPVRYEETPEVAASRKKYEKVKRELERLKRKG